ncbi:MAG: cysteine-rich small domain-containing protein [Anaerofustis sp.]
MSATYYLNDTCPYYPCHEGIPQEEFSCMFCYCPLYALRDKCGGNFTYTESGIKDCSSCDIPHRKENYDDIVSKTILLVEMMRITIPIKNN